MSNPIDSTSFNRMLKVLQMPSEKRSVSDTDVLIPLVKEIQFFKEREIQQKDFPDIVASLKHLQLRPHQYIFHQGEVGDLFYIILDGLVEVLIPNPEYKAMKERQKQKIEELKQLQIQERIAQLHSKKKRSGSKDQDEGSEDELEATIKEPKKKSVKKQNKQDLKKQQSSGASTQRKITFINKTPDIGGVTEDDYEEESEEEEQIPEYIVAVQLGSGKSFGELALINNRPRAATIRCVTESHFAIMSKQDYSKCLSKIEQKKTNLMIEFFHSIPYFQSWSKMSIQKMLYTMEKKQFIKNQTILKEGDPITHIYVIANGEFESKQTKTKTSQSQYTTRTNQAWVRNFQQSSVRTQLLRQMITLLSGSTAKVSQQVKKIVLLNGSVLSL